MEIKVENQTEEKKELSTPPSYEQEGVFLKDRIAQLFNMTEAEKTREGRKLETLIEYAKSKSEDHSPDGIYWSLKQLGLRLGTPPLGEKMLDHAYMYAKLYRETQESKKRLDQMVKGEYGTDN